MIWSNCLGCLPPNRPSIPWYMCYCHDIQIHPTSAVTHLPSRPIFIPALSSSIRRTYMMSDLSIESGFSSFAYYPSEYSVTPAVPLHYRSGEGDTGRPVPLLDLFPLFAASLFVNKSTPIPIAESCKVYDLVPSAPSSSATALSICVMDKCDKELAHITSDSGATYDVLLAEADRFRGGRVSSKERADLVQHFNSYNALDECAIRNCPIDYFIGHSSICVSRNHPFFLQRNMSLPTTPDSFRWSNSSSDSDYSGIRLPTLPLGFPCDPTLTDQATGVILAPTSDLQQLQDYKMSSAGTWATASNRGLYIHLSANALRINGRGVHPWIAKSTLFRGFEAFGTTDVSNLRTPFAAMPGNLYSLGHCPQSTRTWTASRLTGESCATSIECVFSRCVDGKCAEAAGGKGLDPEQALVMVAIDPRYRSEDLERRAQAAMWMWVVIGTVGGLIVLRVLQLWVRKRYATQQEQHGRASEVVDDRV
ncbi:hypothetical protein BCR44DRAFT_332580 [Catenaria anguillulae PL171]|uniref:Uncharacterized protein n=1 Tax=Catenaria anguillulae PL171 TaxID=765915 RepID=A0A1Y2HKW2_9FUNG|nr:hypothetical protein BCR44DRAFT_332580 [Catenaria anguillulae PL171]